jgi:EmrB/QacA subfamily drug resistance transporter
LGNPRALPCDEAAIRSHASSAACAARKSWILAAAVLGSSIAFVDESIVNVALPKIEGELHATLPAMQWVINAYTLCMSALLLSGGAAADQLGRRRIFMTGVGIFAAASIGCGLAGNVQALIGARVVQGVGAALLVPCSLALIGAAFDEKERGAAIGIWSGASAIAAGAAPLVGGWLVDQWSWRAIFLINPVLAVVTLWITATKVPESRAAESSHGIDWFGSVLVFTGLGALVYGLTASSQRGWGNVAVLASLSAALVLLAGFIATERYSRAPMMPLELFRSRTFSGVNILTLLLYGALGGAFFFVPFLLIQAYGYAAAAAGAAYLPFTVVLGLLSRWSGGLLDRFGARGPLIIGPTLTAAGFLCVAASRSYWAILLSMTLLGFGMAVTVAPLTATVLNAVPQHRTGIASGINNAVAAVGGLLLIALLGGVALGVFDRALDRHLASANATPAVRSAVHSARGGFIVPPLPQSLGAEAPTARAIVAASLAETVNLVLRIAAGLALASAVVAALTMPPGKPARQKE